MMLELEETFKNMIELIRNKREIVSNFSEEEKLLLYKYYKQAILGDCYLEEPDIMQYEAYVKWRAWMHMRGVDKQIAMAKYIHHCNRLLQLYCISSYFQIYECL